LYEFVIASTTSASGTPGVGLCVLIPTDPEASIYTRALFAAFPGPVNMITRLFGDVVPSNKSLPVVYNYASKGPPIPSTSA